MKIEIEARDLTPKMHAQETEALASALERTMGTAVEIGPGFVELDVADAHTQGRVLDFVRAFLAKGITATVTMNVRSAR